MEPNLETSIGNIKLKTPFLNASGCNCYSRDDLDNLLKSDAGGMITKTMTLQKRIGNPEPRYYDNQVLSVNSMGLPNMGFDYYYDYSFQNPKEENKPLFFSIATMNTQDVKTMINTISSSTNNISGVEFNISCPNIVGKGQMGYDPEQLNSFLSQISKTKLFDISRNQIAIGLKMSPYFDKYQFQNIADIIKEYPRIDFLTCINGIGNGLVIDIENQETVINPNNGMGGLGGSIVKPTGLANVRQFKNIFGHKLDIIGCGGVENGSDAFEYILTGASCVSVGTALVKNSSTIFTRLNQELKNIMKIKNYQKLNDFQNSLKIKGIKEL